MEHTPPRLRVLLVDDQPLFRRALATLISAQFDMTVVGEGENGRDALDKVRAMRPDLVVMDVNMPGASGVDGVNAIRQAGITTPIVMLTVSEDDDDLFESIKAGANGYLPDSENVGWLGGASSLVIVTVPIPLARSAPVGTPRRTWKVSSGSTRVSPLIVIEMTLVVSPGLKVAVPLAAT